MPNSVFILLFACAQWVKSRPDESATVSAIGDSGAAAAAAAVSNGPVLYDEDALLGALLSLLDATSPHAHRRQPTAPADGGGGGAAAATAGAAAVDDTASGGGSGAGHETGGLTAAADAVPAANGSSGHRDESPPTPTTRQRKRPAELGGGDVVDDGNR